MQIHLDEANLKDACHWLAGSDAKLDFVLQQHGYPPLWARPSGFATLVHILLEQQVSLASAQAAFDRLQAHLGNVTPANFLTINDEDLLRIGFSRQKKGYARGLAVAIISGNFDIDSLSALPEPVLRQTMKTLNGIGDWTVDIYALMCLLRPDVLPKGDIALYESYRVLHGLEVRPNFDFFEEKTTHWRPWRSVGARLLWHFYLCQRKK